MSTISKPAQPQDRPLINPFTQAAEYLCEYTDLVLGAFQAGTGILDGVDEPITLDVARRLLWRETRHVLERLDSNPDDDRWDAGSQTLRIRVAGKDSASILAAVRSAAEKCGCSRNWSCQARCIGPRPKPGADSDAPPKVELPVIYMTIAPVPTLDTVDVFLAELTAPETGCTVRDWVYGTQSF